MNGFGSSVVHTTVNFIALLLKNAHVLLANFPALDWERSARRGAAAVCWLLSTMLPAIPATVSAQTVVGAKFSIASGWAGVGAASSGANFLVALESNTSSAKVAAQLMSSSGAKIGAPIALGRDGQSCCASGVAFDGVNYLVAWEEDQGIKNSWTPFMIYGAFINTAGAQVGPAIAMTTAGVSFDGPKMLAYGGGAYLLTYTRLIVPANGDNANNRYVAGRIVAPNGVLGSEFRISQGYGNGSSVDFDGTNFFVVWKEDAQDYEVRGRFVSPSGALGQEISINASPEPSDYPVLVDFDGANYVVGWTDSTIDGAISNPFAQRVSPSGALVGGVISGDGGSGSNQGRKMLIGLAFDGKNHISMILDMTNDANRNGVCDAGEATCWDLYGRVIGTDGALVGSKFLIDANAGHQIGGVGCVGDKCLALVSSGIALGQGGPSQVGEVYGAFLTSATVNYTLAVASSGVGYGSIAASPSGIDCGNVCSAAYSGGTSVTLTPTPAAGSVFAGWSGDCTGMGACTVSMNAAKNVTAAFNPTGTVYTGVVTNTTLGRQATLTLSIIVDAATNALSGSVSVSNAPGSSVILCGAGIISGVRSANALNFSYTSHDTHVGCGAGVDWGMVFDYAATVKDASTIVGAFTGMGQKGDYSLNCASAPNCLALASQSVTTTSTTSTSTTTTSTTTTTLSGISVALTAGWNLVGNGGGTRIAVATVLNDANQVVTVWKWALAGSTVGIGYPGWAFYSPSQTDGGQAYAASKGYDFMTTIEPGDGFWVNAKIPFELRLPAGALLKSSSFAAGGAHTLGSGWSLIATGDSPTPANFNLSLSTVPPVAGTTPLNLVTLWAWNATKSSWYFWAPHLIDNGGLAAYLATKGYLDFGVLPTSPPGVLSPTTGFWVNRP